MRFLGNRYAPGLALEGYYDPQRKQHVAELTHGHPGDYIRRLAAIQISAHDMLACYRERPLAADLPFTPSDMARLEELAVRWIAKHIVWC